MPEQAILDLPVIEFASFESSPARLHAHCIDSYGLAGFRPHADAVFHFAASLWRYRNDESLKQITALSAFYLRGLSRHVAARRHVAAIRSAIEEQRDRALRTRLAEADEELARAEESLSDVVRLVAELVSDYLDTRRHDRETAARRLEENLDAMGRGDWLDRLETLSRALVQIEEPRIDWTAALPEVLHDLSNLQTPDSGDGNGHSDSDAGLIERLQGEIGEYRELANRAGNRLQQVDRERRELEDLVNSASHSVNPESAARLEQELSEARRQIQDLERERARLADELLDALSSSTDTQETHEELIERLEQAVLEREVAAETLSSLTARLSEVQDDAAGVASQNDELRGLAKQLDRIVEELKQELVASEQRVTQAQANIEALENSAYRNSEFEQFLTESEERLADVQGRLEDAELRADAKAGELDDREYELKKSSARVESQKKTIDSISVQLAEAETLAEEYEARIQAIERENERLRADLSNAQTKMLDAKGDVDEANESARVSQIELERVQETLNETRTKTTSITLESADLRKQIRERDELLKRTNAELDETRGKLGRVETTMREFESAVAERDANLKSLREELKQTRSEAESVREELSRARESAGSSSSNAEQLRAEVESANERLTKAQAELEASRNTAHLGGGERVELRAKVVELEQQVAELRIEQQAASELAKDRRKKLNARVELAVERAENADAEKQALAGTLKRAEKARDEERAELQQVIERQRGSASSESEAIRKLRAQTDELRDKLNESETFILRHQRDFDKVDTQLKSLLEEIGKVADLRAKYEKAEGDRQIELASNIGRRIDSLFAAAGKPVNADRRTEKVVIMTVKKTDEELAGEAEKSFVATNKDEDEPNDDK